MNQVMKKENTAVALGNMFEADADVGASNMTMGDFQMPFLKVLGQLSPQVNEHDASYVEGAKPGMIFQSASKTLIDGKKGVLVVPCYYKREYLEWSDRGQGSSAPVATHAVNSGIVEQAKRGSDWKDRLPNGNYLENTASYYVLTEDMQTALIPMKSTQLKVSRAWNSMMNSIKLEGKNGLFTPSSYSHMYRLKSVQQTNDKGTWFGWSVEKEGPVQDKRLYGAAKEFAISCSSGDVKAKASEDSTEEKSDVPF
tara:strand:+ start:7091 stop:7852 length:762 start_codon:yes stop_codon:yes gene_type:complete